MYHEFMINSLSELKKISVNKILINADLVSESRLYYLLWLFLESKRDILRKFCILKIKKRCKEYKRLSDHISK